MGHRLSKLLKVNDLQCLCFLCTSVMTGPAAAGLRPLVLWLVLGGSKELKRTGLGCSGAGGASMQQASVPC